MNSDKRIQEMPQPLVLVRITRKELPIVMDPDMRGGEPCLRGHRLPVAPLLAELLRKAEWHRKEHAGLPFDLTCPTLWDGAVRDYCSDFTGVCQDDAGEALGFVLLALAQLALDCPATVLNEAVRRAIAKNLKTEVA